MNQFSSNLHTIISNFKKKFLRIGLLLFLMLQTVLLVNAQCDANPVANQTVCNNVATTAINFTGTATTFNWTNNTTSIGLAASGTGNIAPFTALNSTATAVTATITVTPSTGVCTGASISFTITVNPSPVVNVTPTVRCGGVAGLGGCSPLTASGNADVYVWSPLAGLYSNCTMTAPYTGGNATVVHAGPTSFTIYTVTGTNATTGCTNSTTAQVNYTPPAPVVTPNPAIMCLGDPAIKIKIGTAPNTVQFCSGPVNIPVPDNNPAGASNSVLVSGIQPFCTITGMTVTINMPHTRVGNMVFILKAPNGTIINLDYYLSATGGNGSTAGFVNSIISSTGTAFLSTGTNPYTSTFRADAQMVPAGGFGAPGPTGMQPTVSNWNGLLGVPNGNWTLGFYDGVAGDVGTLISWCLGITYSCGPGLPTTPAVWSPTAGLFSDPAAVIPYIAGTPVDSVWTRPTPAGVYTYQVTTQSLPVPLCTPTTNFASSNSNATITFNVKNNHFFPIVLSQIDSKTLTAGAAFVSAYYKTNPIAGLPGAISTANGWNQFGSAVINGSAVGVQPFLSNLNLVIPAGVTYAVCLQALTFGNLPNLSYSALTPGNYPFNDGGCELITGTNIGYSGAAVPVAPTTALSGFVGAVHFSRAIAACISAPRIVVVTVGTPTFITAQPVNKTICTDAVATFTVAAAGAGPYTYLWQVSTNAGNTYTNIADGGIYSGTSTPTLIITAPPVSMSGYYYRVVINGAAACAAVTSAPAILTVNPLPNIVITANPLIIGPTQTTTILSTVTPNPAVTYTWYYNNSVVVGAVSSNLLVNYGSPGNYQLKVTDVNGCINFSNILTIANSFALNMYTYPNPSAGIFQVRYHSEPNNTLLRSFTVYNNMGDRILTRTFTQTIPYQIIGVDIRAHGKGLYWIELRDAAGKRLAINRAVVQ